MKKNISFILSATLLVGLIVVAVLFNTRKPRVMILHSYHTDYSWTKNINVGIKKVLGDRPGYILSYYYMDVKKYTDEAWLRRAELVAQHAVDKQDPDILIAVDNAAQSVASRYNNHPRMKIVFGGVNGPLDRYGYQNANNVTGILENRQCGALRDLIVSVEREKEQGGRKTRIRVRYLMDSSRSVQSDKAYIDGFDWKPLVYAGSFAAEYYTQWQEEVLNLADTTDYVFVTNYRKLKKSKNDQELVPPDQVMQWTEANSPVPLVGLNPFNVEDGCMLSVGTSAYEQGEVMARLAVEILENDASAVDIPVVVNKQFVVAMRKSQMSKRGIELPAIYEAFARATNNYWD